MKILNRKIFYLAVVIVLLVAVLIAVFQLFFSGEGSPETQPPPTIEPPQSDVGETTVDELRSRQGLLSEEQIDEDTIQFEFESGVYLHPDTIIAEDGVVSYEANAVDSDDYTEASYPLLQDYISRYGPPLLTIQGTWRYGPFAQTYVYPELGFSLVGNPTTDEVLEIEYFVPMSTDEYTELYGDNIRQIDSPTHEEKHL